MSLQDAVRKAMDQELQAAGIAFAADIGQLAFPDEPKAVVERPGAPQTLSAALVEHCFPPVAAPAVLAHYTSAEAFKAILDSSELRLYNLRKRVHEGEFASFCEVNCLTEHLRPLPGEAEPAYKASLGDMFYTSFVPDPPGRPGFMWSVYARGGKGVKLVFRAHPAGPGAELRPIRYSLGAKRPLPGVKALASRLLEEFDRTLVLGGIARLAAFFLPLGLGVEEEVRLVVDRGDAAVNGRIVGEGLDACFPLPISETNDICRLELIKIVPGPDCDRVELNAFVAENPKFQHLAW
jgi:hypothetical protein